MNPRVHDPETRLSGAPEFIPGLRLSELFFADVVRPILAESFPALPYSAALIGPGSEVLGYDTARSTDHDWGPRLRLFLHEDDRERHGARIDAVLRSRLPTVFRGYATHFDAPDAAGVRPLGSHAPGPVDHKVVVHAPRQFCLDHLGLDPRDGLRSQDWLLLPQQKLLELTAGRVYHDGLGALRQVRATLAYYPRDVWLYLLASQWRRIAQQEAFVGRTGEVGDEIGSHLVAATLVHDLMRLSFLMERRYAPYSKWFGTAFARLAAAQELAPILQRVLASRTWRDREEHLCAAYEIVARRHNALGITVPLADRVSRFHDRPFRVIHGDHFAAAIVDAIDDADIKALVRRVGLIGSVDQITDNVDVLSRTEESVKLRALFAQSGSS